MDGAGGHSPSTHPLASRGLRTDNKAASPRHMSLCGRVGPSGTASWRRSQFGQKRGMIDKVSGGQGSHPPTPNPLLVCLSHTLPLFSNDLGAFEGQNISNIYICMCVCVSFDGGDVLYEASGRCSRARQAIGHMMSSPSSPSPRLSLHHPVNGSIGRPPLSAHGDARLSMEEFILAANHNRGVVNERTCANTSTGLMTDFCLVYFFYLFFLCLLLLLD